MTLNQIRSVPGRQSQNTLVPELEPAEPVTVSRGDDW